MQHVMNGFHYSVSVDDYAKIIFRVIDRAPTLHVIFRTNSQMMKLYDRNIDFLLRSLTLSFMVLTLFTKRVNSFIVTADEDDGNVEECIVEVSLCFAIKLIFLSSCTSFMDAFDIVSITTDIVFLDSCRICLTEP